MSDSRLAMVRIEIPEKGASFENPRYLPMGTASRLENFRLNQYYARSRAGSITLLNNPDSRLVVELMNVSYPDLTVETIRASGDELYRADPSTNTWVLLNPAGTEFFDGGDKNRFWAVLAPFAGEDKGRIIIGNGVNQIVTWKGGTNDYEEYAGSVPARYGIINHDFVLIVADTLEGGQRHQQRIRWTVPGLATGNALDWTGLGSGFIDLKQTPFPITAIWKQFGQTFVGCSRAVLTITPTGDPLNAYFPNVLNDAEGWFAPRSLVLYGNVAAGMTHNAFSTFNGTTFEAIDGPVNLEWKRRLNYNALSQITSAFDARHSRVGWGLPLDGESYPSEIWWFETHTGRWEIDKLKHTAMSIYSTVADTTTIDELAGSTIDSFAGTSIDDLSTGARLDPLFIYGTAGGATLQFDDTVSTDGGQEIHAVFVSPVVDVLGKEMKVAGQPRAIGVMDHLILDTLRVELIDRGQNYSVAVDASGDGGATWQAFGTASLTSLGPTGTDNGRIVDIAVRGRMSLRDSIQIRLSNLSTGTPWGFSGITALIDVVGRKVG